MHVLLALRTYVLYTLTLTVKVSCGCPVAFITLPRRISYASISIFTMYFDNFTTAVKLLLFAGWLGIFDGWNMWSARNG